MWWPLDYQRMNNVWCVFTCPWKRHALSVTYTIHGWTVAGYLLIQVRRRRTFEKNCGFSDDAWKSNFHWFLLLLVIFTGFSSLPRLELPPPHQTLRRCSCAPEKLIIAMKICSLKRDKYNSIVHQQMQIFEGKTFDLFTRLQEPPHQLVLLTEWRILKVIRKL